MSRQPVNQRPVFLVVVTLALVALLLAVRGHTDPGPKPAQHQRVVGHGQIRFDGAGPERWAQRWRREHATVLALRHRLSNARRVLLDRPNVVEAINLAAATYGYGPTLWRKARCETGGTYDPHALNSSGAAGLFQFLPSTWRSTPYARFPITSAYANALAAGWMHANGRGGEWSCR